ncbi:hypothetical protein TeGR_g4440, partial [Tetraparma gracilis]
MACSMAEGLDIVSHPGGFYAISPSPAALLGSLPASPSLPSLALPRHLLLAREAHTEVLSLPSFAPTRRLPSCSHLQAFPPHEASKHGPAFAVLSSGASSHLVVQTSPPSFDTVLELVGPIAVEVEDGRPVLVNGDDRYQA